TGEGKGSGRSIASFHLHDALAACSAHLARFGGHAHAAGVTVERDRVEAFAAAFERYAAERLSPEDLVPTCRLDGALAPAEIDESLCAALETLAPFGAGNPEPVIALRGVRASGRIVGDNHLKLSLRDAPLLDAIGFGLGERIDLLAGPIDLAC